MEGLPTQPVATPTPEPVSIDRLGQLFSSGAVTTQAPETPRTETPVAPAAVVPAATPETPAVSPVTTAEGQAAAAPADVNWFAADAPETVIPAVENIATSPVQPEFYQAIATDLGLESVPTTPEEFQTTLKAHIEAVRTAVQSSPYQQAQAAVQMAEQQLAYSDEDLVYVDLRTRMGEGYSDEQIDKLIADFQPDDFKRKADLIRANLNTIKTTETNRMATIETQTKADQVKAAQDQIKAQTDLWATLSAGLDKIEVEGQPLKPALKAHLVDYAKKQWSKDLDSDTANFWESVMSANPQMRAMRQQLRDQRIAKEAVSAYIKSMSGAQLNIGNGAGFIPGATQYVQANQLPANMRMN